MEVNNKSYSQKTKKCEYMWATSSLIWWHVSAQYEWCDVTKVVKQKCISSGYTREQWYTHSEMK